MAKEVPELRWTPSVNARLAQTGFANGITVLFSLLLDPEVDATNKFHWDMFPYRRGTRALFTEEWVAIYSVDNSGSVMVYSLNPRANADDLLNPS